jgi:diguanylate cyclase (GGDEF)-like protein/PAS domain S-box-containing protein
MTTAKPRILAIDDVPANLLTLGMALAGEYSLQLADSGAMGLALALQSPPDLILLDVMMPEMDGFETCRRLKAQPALKDIPVVFVTALYDLDSEMAGLALGAADYITKPINVHIARQRIRNLLDREQLRKQVEDQRDRLTDEVARRIQSEETLRSLSVAVEQSPVSVVITDLEGNIEYVNPQFSYAGMWKNITNGQPWHGELINKRKNGELYWEDSQICPVIDADGKPTHYIAVKTDITERVRNAEKFTILMREQKAILNNGLVGIVTVKDRKITWANPAFEEMLGYSAGELVGVATRNNYRSEESYRAFGDAAYPTLAGGKVFRTQTEQVRKDGRPIWVDVSGEMLNQTTGESLWGFIDITEHRQTVDALIESEARFKLIFNETPIGIALVDSLSGQIYAVNPVFAKIARKSVDEMTLMDWSSSVQPQYTKEDRHNLGLMNAGKISGFKMEKHYFFEDGTSIWISMTIAPVYVQDKAHPRHLCLVEDITEHKNLEDQVHQLAFHDTLTQLPNRRLLIDRLTQAMAASKRSGRYAAVMFIDLDNFKPLNDAQGHEAGDQLLIEVATRLTACVREIDTVARFGGDEFVVMLTDLDSSREKSISQAGVVAEKIRARLATAYQLTIRHGGLPDATVQHTCTASVGVALFLDNEGSEDDILCWADKAMYKAKEAGRNAIRFFA